MPEHLVRTLIVLRNRIKPDHLPEFMDQKFEQVSRFFLRTHRSGNSNQRLISNRCGFI